MKKHDIGTLDGYQEESQETDRFNDLTTETGLGMPFMGLIEDSGDMARIYKEILRDNGKIEELEKQDIEEKLGNILWWVSNIARKTNLSLSDIAKKNIDTTKDRWAPKEQRERSPLFDREYPADQQLPDKMDIYFKPTDVENEKKILMFVKDIHGNEIPLGDRLDDNSHEEDGYRYHDVFHLAYYAILGWSPVIRALLKRKRKKIIDPKVNVDKVEDGARAILIEEGLTAYVFQYAKRGDKYFKGETTVDTRILKTIKMLTSHLQVKVCKS